MTEIDQAINYWENERQVAQTALDYALEQLSHLIVKKSVAQIADEITEPHPE